MGPGDDFMLAIHDQDNHDGVITHLEPDILECEIKWALESITMLYSLVSLCIHPSMDS